MPAGPHARSEDTDPHAALTTPSRVGGGAPCVVCSAPIARFTPWKLRDRNVCSPNCSQTLKRRFNRGQFPSPPSSTVVTDSWVAIDFETANSDQTSACAVGLVAVTNGEIVDSYYTLIRPPDELADFTNTWVHGISAADVSDAPASHEALEAVIEFIAGRPLVAHNSAVERDILFDICRYTETPNPRLPITCTFRLAKNIWPALHNHKLPTVAKAAQYDLGRHHNALEDAEACAHIILAALRIYDRDELHTLLSTLGLEWQNTDRRGTPKGERPARRHNAPSRNFQNKSAPPSPNLDADPTHPLHGKRVCFTGELANLSRPEAQNAARLGSIAVNSVTRKTDLLVAGKQDTSVLSPGHTTSEAYRMAEKYGITIIDETALLRLLDER